MSERLPANLTKTPRSHWIKLVVYLVLTIGIQLLPPLGPITAEGMKVLGIFIGYLYAVIRLDSLIWPSLVTAFLIVSEGLVKSSAVIQGWLGNGTVVTMIGFLVLTYGITSSGAAQVIAKWILTRKFTRGRPMLFTWVFLMSCLIVGVFLPPTANILFYMGMWDACMEALGYDPKDNYCRWMILSLSLACIFGCYAWPFKSMPVSIMAPLLSAFKTEVNVAKFVLYSYPMSILMITGLVFLMKIFKANFEPLKNFDPDKVEALRERQKLNTKQIILIIAFIIAVLYSFVPLLIPKGAFLTWFKSWSLSVWVLFVDAVLMIIRIKGQPVLKLETAFKEGIMWRIVAMIGIMSMMGNLLSDEQYGIRTVMSNFLGSVFSGMSWPVFALLFTLAMVIITQFTNNTVLGIIVSTVMAPIVAQYVDSGIDFTAFLVLFCMASQPGFTTPAAYATVSIFLGGKVYDGDSSFLWKYAAPVIGVITVSFWIVIWLFGTIL